jgi:hypothetical protein
MMKKLALLLLLGNSVSAFSQAITLPDYQWSLPDISEQGLTKEVLYTKMNRDLIRLGASICSNRALVWTFDFKRNQNVDAGKIFLFYTEKTGDVGRKTWWYHVAPIVNEKGNIWVMDAGFPGSIRTPETTQAWLKYFSGSTNCKEIKAGENDLIEKMFEGRVFPQTTSYGNYDCYYKYTPGGYWTPASVAKNLLGVDESGTPIRFERNEVDNGEVYSACVEAVTTSVGRIFGSGSKRCKKYLGL